MPIINKKEIVLSDLSIISGNDLVSPGVVDYIEELALDDEYETEAKAAKNFYELLKTLVQSAGDKLFSNRDLYGRLGLIMIRLFWQSFSALERQVRSAALSNNLVFSLVHNVEIRRYLERYIDIYEYNFVPDMDERSSFIKSLESNQESLGRQTINIKGMGITPPFISNWLKDYALSTRKPGKSFTEERRGAYERLDYLNNSQNVKLLSPKEKEVLTQILSLYDWLRFPVAQATIEKEESLPSAKTGPQSPKGFSSYSFGSLDSLPDFAKSPKAPLGSRATPPRSAVPSKPQPSPDTRPKKMDLGKYVPGGEDFELQNPITSKPVSPLAPKPHLEKPRPVPKIKTRKIDLGPYVPGGTEEELRQQMARPAKVRPQVPRPIPTPSKPQAPGQSVKYRSYGGFSLDLMKEAEELSSELHPEVKPAPPKKEIEARPPVTKPVAAKTEAKPYSSPAHELEDSLEKVKRKMEANLPISADETKRIVELIKRKNKS